MDYKHLGGSGLKVPVLSFGTATFGGVGDFFKAWGSTDVAEAKRLIDICLEHGVNFFDTANVYSRGRSGRSWAPPWQDAAVMSSSEPKRHLR